MLKEESQAPKHSLPHILLFIFILLLLIFFLIFKQSGGETTTTEIKNTAHDTSAEDEKEDQDLQIPNEEVGASDSYSGSDNRDQLTILQGVSPSSHSCPSDQSEEALSDTATVECLDDMPVAGEVQDEKEVDEIPETSEILQPAFANINEPFDFTADLEIRVKSFECKTVLETVTTSSNSNDLKKIMENFRKYKDETLSLEERLQVDRSIPYDYIESFNNYLIRNQLKEATGDVSGYFSLYKECVLRLIAKNKGESTYLPDSCGLSFERDVSLIDASNKMYWPNSFRSVLCQKEIKDFPTGATDEDMLYFILPLKVKISAIVFNNKQAADSEEIILNLDD